MECYLSFNSILFVMILCNVLFKDGEYSLVRIILYCIGICEGLWDRRSNLCFSVMRVYGVEEEK